MKWRAPGLRPNKLAAARARSRGPMHGAVTTSAGIDEDDRPVCAPAPRVARRRILDAIARRRGQDETFGDHLSNPDGACACPPGGAAARMRSTSSSTACAIVGPSRRVRRSRRGMPQRLYPMRLILPGRCSRARPRMRHRRRRLDGGLAVFYYNAAKGGLANASKGLRGSSTARRSRAHRLSRPRRHRDGAQGLRRLRGFVVRADQPARDDGGLARLVRRGVERRTARIVYPRFYVTTPGGSPVADSSA